MFFLPTRQRHVESVNPSHALSADKASEAPVNTARQIRYGRQTNTWIKKITHTTKTNHNNDNNDSDNDEARAGRRT